MWNKPTREQLAVIPKLYETEHVTLKEKLIYLHFFIGGSDWFISEYDGKDIFWGYVILGEDYFNAEWGYISLAELSNINVQGIEIDNDLCWNVREALEVEKISRGHNWQEVTI